jgi:hypothetical protein
MNVPTTAPMSQPIELRIQTVLDVGEGEESRDELLAEGYARALRLDANRLDLEREITALAARADNADNAQRLRKAWLRHRTVMAELRELRALLRQLKT